MTNRDKINKISNSELADLLGRTFGIGKCDFCCYEKEGCSGKSCFDAIEMWLSAPCVNEAEKQPVDNKAEKLSKKLKVVFMTNGDKIKSMDNAELAKVLNTPACGFCIFSRKSPCGGECLKGVEGWLKLCTDGNPPADKIDKPQQEAPAERNPDKTMINNVTADNVNHPAHYNRDGAMECIPEMVVIFGYEATINFCNLNAWKYRYRSSEKNGAEDMAKSDWYVKKADELKAEAGYL